MEIAHALLLPSIITAEDIGRLITPELTVKSISDSIPYKILAINDRGITLQLENGNTQTRNHNHVIQAYSNLRANMPLTGGDAYQAAIAKYIQDNWLDETRCKTIQFHPSYSYEDFVRGIVAKPNPDGEGIIYEAENKTIAAFAKTALDNYNLSKASDKKRDMRSDLQRFISYVIEKIDTEGKFRLTDNVYIFYVDNKRFKYKGDNWTAHPNGLNMNFSELEKILDSKQLSRPDINKNKELNELTRQHATYYTKL